ncbi:hypothetical protein Skr01_06940 [Sphaerisporangium krabiense]|uniref:Glycosyltransferase n=1 Tax=Sphaerisporangium krabiense TaxID=763782 RepID=A0A7W8ZDA4_9ACTN|nr:hypothetical protein [Sphaerisporangium krabiense]MBB5631755.1 hypothetical protein [Sphaerisporangium krabiense]GII60609.1 hypothetical protein Skr01_06940 [Sphaerisporangium krabiense]
MKIGYSFWGFLGPGILDTPDGGRFWRRGIADELLARGHELVMLQRDRDLLEAGMRLPYQWDEGFPALDALLCEWRWPLPGRNTTVCGSDGHTCDLHRQDDLLDHYTHKAGTPTVLWDTDRQMSADDPLRAMPHVLVCDPALLPDPPAAMLPIMVPDALLDAAEPARLTQGDRPLDLAYVGNQYDRDEAFARFFAPAAAHVPHRVAGKWTRTLDWPGVNFTGRAAFTEVNGIYGQSVATVLLMPDRYSATGAISQRLPEAVLAGCLPLTPATLVNAGQITPPVLHVEDATQVLERLAWLREIQGSRRHVDLISDCLGRLELFRTSRQVGVLEQYLTTLTERHAEMDGAR